MLVRRAKCQISHTRRWVNNTSVNQLNQT